ncbi:hypothetical protein ACQKRQ_34840 [Paraburkholderia sp. NPDC080076]|jgi:hypothetical protein
MTQQSLNTTYRVVATDAQRLRTGRLPRLQRDSISSSAGTVWRAMNAGP